MLRKFKVNVNDKAYIVELEELDLKGTPISTPVQTVNHAPNPVASAPKPAPVAQTAPAPAPAASGNGITLEAPMPGNILEIKVKLGDKVEFEQPLVVLEAMKMENELVSPKAGTVTAIHVTANSAIDVGQPIITIE